MSLTYTSASGVDIERIVKRIEKAVEEERMEHVVISCAVVAILRRYPDIDEDSLLECVKGVTEWISCYTPEMCSR